MSPKFTDIVTVEQLRRANVDSPMAMRGEVDLGQNALVRWGSHWQAASMGIGSGHIGQVSEVSSEHSLGQMLHPTRHRSRTQCRAAHTRC